MRIIIDKLKIQIIFKIIINSVNNCYGYYNPVSSIELYIYIYIYILYIHYIYIYICSLAA